MKKIFSPNFSLLILLLSTPFLAYGQAEIGIFEMKTPNAMIIFDTSSSMNMNSDGIAVPDSRERVKADGEIDPSGTEYHFNGGGDHPKSKLYQAKLALKSVIKELQNVNLGFATYGQFRQERRRGYYRRWLIDAGRKWCEKRYWRWTSIRQGPHSTYSSSPNSFIDRWGRSHTAVSVGTRFYGETIEIWDKGSRIPPHNNLRKKSYDLWYTVTQITYSAEYNRYTYRYESDMYDDYQETIMTIDGCGDCQTDRENRPFPRYRWEWSTYFSGEGEYENPYGGRETKSYWQCQKRTQGGSEHWEYDWRTISGTECPRTDGEWEFVGNCYDHSHYYYPIGPNSPTLSPHLNRPHTWSYFKVEGSLWPEAKQQVPYYPAMRAEPGQQDNHFFFVNFPETDDRNSNYQTRNKITDWLDLTPVENPETKRHHTKLPLKINAITSNTIESVYTPLADSLSLAKKYFDDYMNNYKGGDAASKAQCRGNYVILLTDGLESCRFLDPPTNLIPDYGAAARASAELLGGGVKTFVIGFGKDIKGNDTLNKIAEGGGTEKAYFAENAAELRDAFKVVFQAIAGNYSRSNPVVTREGDRLYRTYLSLPGWKGHLVAYDVDQKENLSKKWDAGEIMNSRGRGNVYTWPQDNKEPKREKFGKQSAKRIKEHLNPSSKEEDIDEDGKKDEKDAETIIEFILDPKHNNGKHKGDRSPLWKLGDIYHSSPVIVGKPAFNFPDDLFPRKYSDFKRANENRATSIYVGANDGMLHVFDDKGTEKFAAIPKNILGNLKDLRLGHRFYIDSSPTAYDVYLRKGKNDWRTIVMSGERSGGTYYFAIDVTTPDDPDQLWELTDANMGMTWSRPEIGRVKIAGVEKFVAFVGGGYSLSDQLGNTFYVIDIDEGVILKKFIVGNSTNKVPAGARAFDRDLDGRVDGVYFGDIQGTLWKIKIDGNDNAEDWKLIELFKSDGGRPIFYPPAVTKNNQGKVLVYFGQGDELNLFDTQQYTFYEIWDKGDQGEKLWAFALPGRGEKVLAAPGISDNVIYFTAWENTESVENCGAGKGRLYGLTSTRQGREGGLPALYFDAAGTRLDKPIPSLEVGIGIPSAPVVTNGWIYVSSSFNADETKKIKIPPWGKGKLKSWREVF
jgi:hypothetical protein